MFYEQVNSSTGVLAFSESIKLHLLGDFIVVMFYQLINLNFDEEFHLTSMEKVPESICVDYMPEKLGQSIQTRK